jgi:RNA recognition motif-containing protein
MQFDDIKDAQKAMEGTNGKQFMGRTITSEYVQNENPFSRSIAAAGGGGGGGRDRSRSPPLRGGRSPSSRRRYEESANVNKEIEWKALWIVLPSRVTSV